MDINNIKAFRVRFVIDEDASFEECNGKPRPLSEDEYAENYYMKDGEKVSYADYLDYQGNPDRHVYFGCIVEGQCACCDTWKTLESLWDIDVMDDDPAYRNLTLDVGYPAAEAVALPDYLGETTRELLDEAGYTS